MRNRQPFPAVLSATLLGLVAAGCQPTPAQAQGDESRCRHSSPQQIQLDMEGVREVAFDVGPHTLRLEGTAAAAGTLQGRACASTEGELARLRIEQSRDGDRLEVRLEREDRTGWTLGERYARFDLEGSVPESVRVVMRVGSGDGRATGLSELGLTVGSGDADVQRISGKVDARVGSGDIVLTDIGSLDVGSVGSGDLEARGVRGDARVGSVGSGDLDLRDVAGSVDLGSVGSGDARLERVTGNVEVGSVGSGDIDIDGVDGDLRVHVVGSGSVDHRGVKGRVELPRKR